MAVRCALLTPERWPDLERLFGPNGACAGCWCMWWRLPRGGKLWEETRGAPAKRRFRALVRSGRAGGILAYDGKTPVGWCAFGPRADFPRVERMKAFARPDDAEPWSLNCFYVARPARGTGVTRALLAAAIAACRRRGATLLEAYPVTTTAGGGRVASSFAYTGPLPIFLDEGFEVVQRLSPTRPMVRKPLK